jgi:rhodanese-related sulfurtransferase
MRTKIKKSIKEAVFIGLAAIICGLLFNNFYHNGIPLIAQSRELKFDTLAVSENITDTTFTVEFEEPLLITLEQAYDLFRKNSALFIDSRDAGLYEYGHIPGAISLPWKAEAPPAPDLEIPQTYPIVTYCSDEACEMAMELAYYLFGNGYRNIRIFHGGYEEWTSANYPIEKGGAE